MAKEPQTAPVDSGNADEKQLADLWLSAELNRIWLVAERTMRQLQKAQLRAQPDHPSVAEIEGIFTARRATRGGGSTGPFDEAELGRALADADAKIQELRSRAPIGRLVENLNLRPLEVETLIVAMSPHIDAPLADAFNLLRGPTQNRRGVDMALVAQLFQLKRTERVGLLDVMDPERPLLAWRLVQVMPAESAEAYGSVNYRAIQPTFDLLSVLCGRGDLSPALARSSALKRAPANLDGLKLDAPFKARVQQVGDAAAVTKPFGDFPWLLLWGPRGVGKAETAARIAARANRPLLCFQPMAVDKNTLDDMLRRAQREALIRGAMLYIGPLSGEYTNEASMRELARRIISYPSVVAIGVETMQPPRLSIDHAIQELKVELLSEPTRLAMWETAVPKETREEQVNLASLSRGFNLSPGEILETARDAMAIARSEKGRKIDHNDLRTGVDRRLRNELGELARRIVVSTKWEDLVLNEEEQARIREFISRKLFAFKVYGEWGYGDRINYGKGMIALFSGPPGTGKTMLAGLIAKSLDLDMYQVDLAMIVSKWVGETEKQLAKVFDQAERAQAVLLFDEADSLFAKRTEVKSSNDRYGNLAVNYLLQRLESYTGVAILTTNKDAAIDDAVQRRLALHLHFEIPEPLERERLWKSFLPAKAPVGPINLTELANEYELTGGYIKNAAVRAAFLAAQSIEGEQMITQKLLRRAASLEMEDMGRVVMRREQSLKSIA